MVIIHSKGFKLRPIEKGDEYSLVKNINNKKIAGNMSHIPYPYKLRDARLWVSKNLRMTRKGEKVLDFVIDSQGEAIGMIGLEIDKTNRYKAQFGYWLGERYWRQGIMTEAVKIFTDYAYKKLKIKRLFAEVFASNKASARVLKRAGYKLEGVLKKNSLKNNKLVDDLIFAKVK